MVKKYSFGNPIETDAVVKDIAETEWKDGVFRKVGNSFHYILRPDEIIYGLGENVRGMNKRGWRYVSECADNPNHCEHTSSLYGAHNFIMVGDGVQKTCGLFVDTPGRVTFDAGYTDILLSGKYSHCPSAYPHRQSLFRKQSPLQRFLF